MKNSRGLLAVVTALTIAPMGVLLSAVLTAEASGALSPGVSAPLTECGVKPVKAGAEVDGYPALDADQIGNAQIIYNVAQDPRLPASAPVIAIAWETLAAALVSTFSGAASACLKDDGGRVPASGTTRLPAGFLLPTDTPAAVQAAIRYSVAQLGKPYLWGATGPDAFDCSGLVMMAYRAGGFSIPRTTFQQVLVGTPIYGLGALTPGDLLFSAGSDGTATDPGHVGMYLGSGLVIEAPKSGEPVMVTPLAHYWQQETVAIRRIV